MRAAPSVRPEAAVAAPADPRFARPRTLFFGIGAQKSATSWLDKHLRGHPEICMPVRKEQHYWTTRRLPQPYPRQEWVAAQLRKIAARGLYARATRSRRGRMRDEAWRRTEAMLRHDTPDHRAYADVLFQAWRGEPVVGEITPEYALLGAEDFAEMARLGSDVRFLFIMREPLGRLHSGVRQFLRKNRGPEAVTPANVAARLEEAVSVPGDPAMARSRYDLTIARLESVVPPERVCYLFFETMFSQEEMDRLARFLGVAPTPAQADRPVHASAGGDIGLAPELAARAEEALAPVYRFVSARFGALTPETWRKPRPAEARAQRAGEM
jgi:hypothetical protein